MAQEHITKERIRNHWSYSWWKYLLLAAVCIAAVNITFAVTAYRAPEDKKIEIYFLNGYCDTESVRQALEPQFFEEHPEQEELTVMNINISDDNMYGAIQFTTYMTANQGDVCLMPGSEVLKLSADGAEYSFVDLTPYVSAGVIPTDGIDLTEGTLARSTGETGIFAIPADGLHGLKQYGNDPSGSMLCVLDHCGNEETAASVVGMLMERFGTDELPEDDSTPGDKPMVLF